MSDKLTDVIHTLYSEDNKAEWKNKRDEGLVQFLKSNHTFKWEGFSVQEVGNSYVDCFYNAEIELYPTKMAIQNKDLQKLLKKNPFMTKESIYAFYEKKLKKYLDPEFEEYCTCDDYYEPVVEDFELTYDVEHWCKENGFEVISYEGDGSDGGYEPKFRRSWQRYQKTALQSENLIQLGKVSGINKEKLIECIWNNLTCTEATYGSNN